MSEKKSNKSISKINLKELTRKLQQKLIHKLIKNASQSKENYKTLPRKPYQNLILQHTTTSSKATSELPQKHDTETTTDPHLAVLVSLLGPFLLREGEGEAVPAIRTTDQLTLRTLEGRQQVHGVFLGLGGSLGGDVGC